MSTTNILKLRRAGALPEKALVYVVDEASGDKDAKNLAIYAGDLVTGAPYQKGDRPIGTIGGAIDDATAKAANAAQKSELAAPTGAGEVGTTGGQTVQQQLDNIPSLVEDAQEVIDAGEAAIAIQVAGASAAKTAAELAAIAAVAAGSYTTDAQGLAATTNGQSFLKRTADLQVYDVMQNNAGVALLLGKLNIPPVTLGTMVTDSPNINFDLANGLLKIAAGLVRVVYGRTSFLLVGGDYTLPSSGAQLVLTDPVARGISFQPSGVAIPAGSLLLGVYYPSTKRVYGFPPHNIDGVLVGSYTPSLGFVFGPATGINFVTTTQRMVIAASTIRLFTPTKSWLLPATDLALPAASGYFRIEYSTIDNTVYIVTGSTAVDSTRVIFGFLEKSGTLFNVTHIEKYLIDGKDPSPKVIFAGMLVGSPENINFDFQTSKLKIPASTVRLHYGNASKLLAAQDVTLSATGVWYRLIYSAETDLITIKTSASLLTGDEIQIGAFNGALKLVTGVSQYYINGAAVGVGVSELQTAELVVPNGNTDAGYVQPPLPAYASFLATAVHTDIYALYDALVAAYPEYVSRTLLGLDGGGKTIYRYDFVPTPVPTESQSGDTAKIILFGGVHGFEKAGVYTLYLAMREICTRWKADDRLESLRWETKFVVVPVAVPYGFDNNTRKNENSVDVARNFTAGWVLTDPSDVTYGGPNPLSEKSSQYLNALMAANKDAIYCGSFHNFGGGTDLVWNASATRFGVRLAKRLVSRLSRSWKSRYAWIPQADNAYIGYASITSPAGSESKQSTDVHGIQSSTFEINAANSYAPDATAYSTHVATLGTEAFINWLLLNLEFGAQLRNSSVRMPA